MSIVEFKNMRGKCLDKDSFDEVVLHEVEFDRKDSGVWEHHVVQIMATDPMDAINAVKSQGA
jgi:hypothetical protein